MVLISVGAHPPQTPLTPSLLARLTCNGRDKRDTEKKNHVREDSSGKKRERERASEQFNTTLCIRILGDGFFPRNCQSPRKSQVPLFTAGGLGVGQGRGGGGAQKTPSQSCANAPLETLIHPSRWPRSRALHPQDSLFFFHKEPVLADVEVPGREKEPASPAPGPVPEASGGRAGRPASLPLVGDHGWAQTVLAPQAQRKAWRRDRDWRLSWRSVLAPRPRHSPARPDFLGRCLGLAND